MVAVRSRYDGRRGFGEHTRGAAARYDIELVLLSGEGGLQLSCDYSTELLEAHTVSRWMRGMLELLRQGMENETEPCRLLPVMPPSDQQTLLHEWNATEKPYPRDRTVLGLITEQIDGRPGDAAVRCGAESLTYAQLGRRMERIAGLLRGRGVRAGDPVGIFLPRSSDLIPAILAVWRVGALYVPLDCGFPPKRLAYMIEDASVRTMITTRASMDVVESEFGAAALCVDDEADAVIAGGPAANASGSAYIIYTSGSTGRPKGVEVPHDALLNVLLAIRDLIEFKTGDLLLAITTVSFDISFAELLVPLVAGGVVDLGEEGLAGDGLALAEWLTTRRSSFVQATASTWKAVLAAGWTGSGDVTFFPQGKAVLQEMDDRSLQLPHYDCRQTLDQLRGSSIVCEPVGERLLGTYMPYLNGIGYLPLPMTPVGVSAHA